MKKLTVLAISFAAMLLLTACPHKPLDEPSLDRLTTADVAGYYEGTYTVIVNASGDPEGQALSYPAHASLRWEFYGGVDSSVAFRMEAYAMIADSGRTVSLAGGLQGESSVFSERGQAPYPLSTRWGELTLHPAEDWGMRTPVSGRVELQADGTDLLLAFSDTLANYVDAEGVLRELTFRHSYSLSKLR